VSDRERFGGVATSTEDNESLALRVAWACVPLGERHRPIVETNASGSSPLRLPLSARATPTSSCDQSLLGQVNTPVVRPKPRGAPTYGPSAWNTSRRSSKRPGYSSLAPTGHWEFA
jgi:hypothetical protein